MKAKFKYCLCGKEINSNISLCSDCFDIRIYGSKEKAREAIRKNFDILAIKAIKK